MNCFPSVMDIFYQDPNLYSSYQKCCQIVHAMFHSIPKYQELLKPIYNYAKVFTFYVISLNLSIANCRHFSNIYDGLLFLCYFFATVHP